MISEQPAHPALVSEADFVAVKSIRADVTAPEHTYQLAGLLRCGHCRRRMESCWSNGRAAYRCRHGPALHLMRTGEAAAPAPVGALARLRADGIGLIYDQAGRTVTADTEKNERITIGR